MAILFLQDKDYVRFRKVGVMTKHLGDIIVFSEILNLPCLSTVEQVGDTIFNHKQLQEVWKEILQLQKYFSSEHLTLLLTAVEAALENDTYYLVISGD